MTPAEIATAMMEAWEQGFEYGKANPSESCPTQAWHALMKLDAENGDPMARWYLGARVDGWRIGRLYGPAFPIQRVEGE